MTNGTPDETKQENNSTTQQEEPKKKRLKLRELAVSPEANKSFMRMIIERITNLGIVTRSGSSPTECLMSEICIIESKLDALMLYLEEKHDIDFTEFNTYLENSALQGAATAVNIRTTMMKR